MDAISSQAVYVVVTEAVELVPEAVLDELYAASKAEFCGLGRLQFGAVLATVGERLNWNVTGVASEVERVEFLRGLRLEDLALAHGCALGLDKAWERFVDAYREPLVRAAVAISGSATEGHELAGSLYGDLFGLKERDGARRSPLHSYSGRGSLMGWLRTTLAQRHVDRHRKTHRESPLDENTDEVAAQANAINPYAEALAKATGRTLTALSAEDRFLLASYFLDGRTLLEIARLLRVHEATISRRIKRLTEELRKQLMRNLQAGGLSHRAAEEALGTDPRDVEINLKGMLQGSHVEAF